MKKVAKKLLWTTCIMAFVCIVLMLICNQIVVNNAEGIAFSDIDSIKYNKVGLLLGTTPQARITKVKNYFFIYRIDAAEELYKAGKIEQILISGDENSLDGINEPECMKDSLVARGIPASAIILDGKGYRTICSIINANKVYGLKSFTIISQEFHNELPFTKQSTLNWMWRTCRLTMPECPSQEGHFLLLSVSTLQG